MSLLLWLKKFQVILYKIKKWIKVGLAWGLWMFVIMSFIFPYFNKEDITIKSILLGLIIWSLAGLVFGYTMKKKFKD